MHKEDYYNPRVITRLDDRFLHVEIKSEINLYIKKTELPRGGRFSYELGRST